MIIKGGARSSGGFFAYHLMKTEENERVEVKEMRGLLADTVPEAFQEMRMVAAGTRADNYFYHASINPRADEVLTPEQWDIAVDTLEKNLGLTDHARFQVEHEKDGRTHRHIVWSRVDLDTMTVTPASGNYLAHDKTRLELEREFSHEPTPPTPQPSQRRSREIADWENFRAAESGINPAEMKAEITELWQQSDGGRSFQAAIEEKGYLLAKGDRRDFVLIDPTGDIHSLARRIDGARATDIRAKMGDLDRDSLMGAKEASAWMKAEEENSGGSTEARILPEEQRRAELDPRTAPLEQLFPDALPYVPDIRERTNQFEAQWLQHLGSMSAEDWAQEIDDNERAWQHCFGHIEAARQQGKTTERPAQDADPTEQSTPLSGKHPDESWSQFVTRTQPPDRELMIDTPDEPELER